MLFGLSFPLDPLKETGPYVNHLFRKTGCLILAVLCAALWTNGGLAQNETSAAKVYVVPIAGNVEPSMAAFLKRVVADIPDSPESVIVLEMDTFGGRVDSALEMVDILLNVKNAKTIAFVTNKAISAGALISLACQQLVMKNHTTLGDCAPITYSNKGPQMMGEKFQSPLRAKFRTLAKRNGYPVVLAESMVTADMEVYRITLEGETVYLDAREYEDLAAEKKEKITGKKTIVAAGELLTMDDTEARELGFSSMSVDSIAKMLTRMDLSAAPVTRIEVSWSEDLVSLIGTLSPILMLIGLGALYTEIKAPGFGAPGIIGILCLALVFLNQYLVGLASYTELLILVFGLVLLGFELFVLPGFGIAGFAGIICIAIAMLLGFQDFVIPDPKFPWEKALLVDNLLKVLSAVFGAFLMALFILRYVFPRLSKTIAGPYLATTLTDARVVLPPAAADLQAGQTGTAMTLLRPSGKAVFNDEVYDVIAQGAFIEKGTGVRIIKIKGAKIIVDRTDAHA